MNKKTTQNISNGMAFEFGAGTLKANFDKATGVFDAFQTFGKETVEACVQAATAAGQGVQSINEEIYSYSKKSIDDSVSLGRKIMSAKSPKEAFEIQAEFARTYFASFFTQATKFGGLLTTTTRESYAPLQGRFEAFIETTHSATI